MTEDMTIGERVAFHRRRRGLSQEVLAGLIGRTADWLRKVEHNRVPLDRVSVIRQIARTLAVPLGDLLAEPTLEPSHGPDRARIRALRTALMDHRPLAPSQGRERSDELVVDDLEQRLAQGWTAYQHSRYGQLSRRLPHLVSDAHAMCRDHQPGTAAGRRAHRAAAGSHQLAAAYLTKLGEGDLACLASATGLTLACTSEDTLTIGSLDRSVAHSLLSIGEYDQAITAVNAAVNRLGPGLGHATDPYLSIYGMLHLVGAVASARRHDRPQTTAFLTEADSAAQRLGGDANHLWTAFGPTNVAIHRVTAALELGDLQLATDLGPRIDTASLPTERRIRHTIETSRALVRRNRIDTALDLLLTAERHAPEHIRYHRLSRMLVREVIARPRPPTAALDLATRMGVRDADPRAEP